MTTDIGKRAIELWPNDIEKQRVFIGAAAWASVHKIDQQWLLLETVPRDGTVIDFWCGANRETDCFYKDGSWWQTVNAGDGVGGTVLFFEYKYCTHWRNKPCSPILVHRTQSTKD